MTARAYAIMASAGPPEAGRGSAGPPADQATARLAILATSDLHHHLLAYDYHADAPSDAVGLSRTATLVAEERRRFPNTLLFDNGDTLSGNPMGDFLAVRPEVANAGTPPLLAAMNALCYDAATVGNHDFDHGIDHLRCSYASAAFPVIAANLAISGDGSDAAPSPVFAPFAVLDRRIEDDRGVARPIRVGVIGFAPPQTAVWTSRRGGPRLVAEDIVAAARRLLPELRAHGADIVVALAHTGIGTADAPDGSEDAAIPLSTLTEIDALVLGHAHQVFPSADFARDAWVDPVAGTIGGKPAVMPGFHGSHLGVIELALCWRNGRWSVTGHRVRTEPIAVRDGAGRLQPRVGDRHEIVALADPAHRATLEIVRRPIGATQRPLRTYFALVSDCEALRLVAAAQMEAVARMLAGSEHAGLPLLSAVAPFKAGGRGGAEFYSDVPPGPLLLRHAADLYLYPNMLRAVRVRGEVLRDWLERSAGIFATLTPGQTDQPLHDPAFPSYNFDVIYGLTCRIDLTAPPLFTSSGERLASGPGRVRDLMHLGRPVAPDAEFLVATNSFRSSGGGRFPGLDGSNVVLDTDLGVRDCLVDHIRSGRPAVGSGTPAWHFAPVPRTAAWFDSSPRAAAILPDEGLTGISPIGPGAGGFWRYRLSL